MGGSGNEYTFYVDDSGIPREGLALYSWIEVPKAAAERLHEQWLEYRTDLAAELGIPVTYELHAHRFIGGRGRPRGLNPTKKERRHAAQRALDTIAAMPALRVGCVYAWNRYWPAVPRERAFSALLRTLESRLDHLSARGAIVVDGDGTDPMYGHHHSEVAPRRIPCPPAFEPAHASQWLQMADLVAYTACQAIARQDSRQFMWGWYSRHLPKAEGPLQA